MADSLITCGCGAKVRLPKDGANRALRCPKCKSPLILTIDAQILKTERLQVGGGAKCAICQSALQTEDVVVTCPACDQVYHQECWAEIGGCGTYGCREAAKTEKGDAQTPVSGWGDTKECPACGETIKSIALRCRHCDTAFDTVDPLTRADLRRKRRRDEADKQLKTQTVVVFVLSLMACVAPFILIFGGLHFKSKREDLERIGPLFVVLVYSSMIISLLYSLVMVSFLLYHLVAN